MSEFIPNDNKAFIAMIRNTNPQLTAAAPEMYELLKIWVQIQVQPTLMNAKDTARKLLDRIDGKEV